jgi:thiol-disulfide isomerase/thioredoxin
VSTAPATSAHAPSAPPRKLCEKELGQPGRRLPKTSFTPVAASGVAPPANDIPTGNGRWTWINFFAAWCGPCKEEMPRLRTFQEKLAANMTVSFVSLDDDERQLRKLLEGSADAGAVAVVKSALWLEPGKSRSAWLTALKMKDPPDLPAHVLVDPTGKVRCILGGAVDEADFPTVAAIVRR